MANPLKQIRGQIRQIVMDLLPSILAEELKNSLYKSLSEDMHQWQSRVENNVKETLTLLDNRSKDTLGYLVRQMAVSAPVMPDTVTVARSSIPGDTF